MTTYDLLLKNGMIIDPARRIHSVMDVAFSGGKVVVMDTGLSETAAHRTIDCSGAFVAPGMIDLHVHAYWGVSNYGLENPDTYCITRGATTILDPGSAGADTFQGFKKYVIDKMDTRIYVLINVSSLGMISFDIPELVFMDALNVKKALKVIEENRDVIVGVKVRLGAESQTGAEETGLEPLEIAREIADHSGLTLMVHPLEAFCDSIDDILPYLKAGDILTHTFHRYRCGVLDDEKRIRDSVIEARKRRVIFDVGHGMASFSWEVAEASASQGFWPDTISSDLHAYNFKGPVFDLATTASKFLHLGMPIHDVVAALTIAPGALPNC